MKNALAEYYAKKDKEKNRFSEVHGLVTLNFEDSFLFDKERLLLQRCDDEFNDYVTAVDIYKEFEKIDKKLKNNSNYNTESMLEIMEELIENRYQAFKNEFDRRYKEPPGITKTKYLQFFENTLATLFERLEIDFYPKGFTNQEQKLVHKSMGETII